MAIKDKTVLRISSNLPVFQMKNFRKILSERGSEDRIQDNIEVNFPKYLSLLRLNSLWHGGETASFCYKSFEFIIEAVGDVRAVLYRKDDNSQVCYVKDKSNGGYFENEMRGYFSGDKTLNTLLAGNHKVYELSLIEGNWWECTVINQQNGDVNRFEALDADDLFSAVAEAVETAGEWLEFIAEN